MCTESTCDCTQWATCNIHIHWNHHTFFRYLLGWTPPHRICVQRNFWFLYEILDKTNCIQNQNQLQLQLNFIMQKFLQASLRGDVAAVEHFITLGVDLECMSGVSNHNICVCLWKALEFTSGCDSSCTVSSFTRCKSQLCDQHQLHACHRCVKFQWCIYVVCWHTLDLTQYLFYWCLAISWSCPWIEKATFQLKILSLLVLFSCVAVIP